MFSEEQPKKSALNTEAAIFLSDEAIRVLVQKYLLLDG
jgi:hypothetical protein